MEAQKTIRTAITAVAALALTALVGYISMVMQQPWIMCAMAVVPSLVSTMMAEKED
jgi:hypothetical protein